MSHKHSMRPDDWISSRDGTKLFTHASFVKNPKHAIVLVHGFAEHIGRYIELMAQLNSSGASVLGVDLRGHGRSHGKRGYIDCLEQYEEDLDAAVQKMRKDSGFKQVIVVSHSMGALVASCYAAKNSKKLCGLVMSSPLFAISHQIPYIKVKIGELMSRWLPGFSLPSTLQASVLTHDPAAVRAYQEDPLVFHHVTARWFDEVTHVKEKAFQLAKKIKIPLLLQLSAEDHVVDFESSKQWFDRLPGADCTLKVYEGFYHEIYNELLRDKPISDLLSWLKKHEAPEAKTEA